MVKTHLLAAAALAALSIAASLLAGPASRSALVGAVISGATGLVSIWAFGRGQRPDVRPVQHALLVFVVMFLVRLVLIGVGLATLVRAGQPVIPFVVAFFVPYFAFTVIEGSLLASLGRTSGKPA